MYSYTAKVVEKIDNGPGITNSIRVGVFRIEDGREEQIAEYTRNYSALFSTFCYFRKNGKDYALYSPNYTATRIIELPSGQDIGGEEPDAWGFCPDDYYVPPYLDKETVWADGHVSRFRLNGPLAESFQPSADKSIRSYAIGDLAYYPFGFVSGCAWGDDSSLKIQYLDLAEVDKGIIKRDARFGYIELAKGLSLKQAIDLYDYLYDPNEEDAHCVTISIQQCFDLRTGKLCKSDTSETLDSGNST